LQGRNLVSVRSDSADRRRRCLKLTRQGERMAVECASLAKGIRRATIDGFSQAELATLSSYLKRLVDNLDRFDLDSPLVSFGAKGSVKLRASGG
jgi:DNA-binding MarR family transcriptional regulator